MDTSPFKQGYCIPGSAAAPSTASFAFPSEIVAKKNVLPLTNLRLPGFPSGIHLSSFSIANHSPHFKSLPKSGRFFQKVVVFEMVSQLEKTSRSTKNGRENQPCLPLRRGPSGEMPPEGLPHLLQALHPRPSHRRLHGVPGRGMLRLLPVQFVRHSGPGTIRCRGQSVYRYQSQARSFVRR